MNASRAAAAAAVVLILGSVAPASADDELDYDLEGFSAIRLFTAWNLPVSPVVGADSTTQFVEYRTRLAPSIELGPVSAEARLLVFDGVLAGNQSDGVNALEGLDEAVSSTNRELENVDSLDVDRLWLTWASPVGEVRLGRQGSHWGLGIQENAADGLEWGLEGNGPQGSGDTFDRFQIATDLSSLAPDLFAANYLFGVLGYDLIAEGNPDVGNDDTQRVVAALLLTDQEAPGAVGGTELGVYGYWLNESETDTDVGVVDLYGRLELEFADGLEVWAEAEGFAAFGSSTRSGVVSSVVFDRTSRIAEASYQRFYEEQGLDVDVAAARAAEVVRRGGAGPVESEALAAPLTAALEQQTNIAADTAAALADRIASNGLRALEMESVDVSAFGGMGRAGVRTGPLTAFIELAGTGDLDSDSATPPAVVGVGGGRLVSAGAAFENTLAGDLITRGLSGTEVQTFAFDGEYEPAVILFDQVGPLGRDGAPTVANAWYQRVAASYQLYDDLELWGSVIYGKLVTSVRPITVICDEQVQCEDGDPDLLRVERGDLANGLGVEIDAGAVYQATKWLRGEVKGGYLFTGDAFGPARKDVSALRLQVAVEF